MYLFHFKSTKIRFPQPNSFTFRFVLLVQEYLPFSKNDAMKVNTSQPVAGTEGNGTQ